MIYWNNYQTFVPRSKVPSIWFDIWMLDFCLFDFIYTLSSMLRFWKMDLSLIMNCI